MVKVAAPLLGVTSLAYVPVRYPKDRYTFLEAAPIIRNSVSGLRKPSNVAPDRRGHSPTEIGSSRFAVFQVVESPLVGLPPSRRAKSSAR